MSSEFLDPGLSSNQAVPVTPSLAEHLQQGIKKAGTAMNGVFVALEVNPITNEGARVAALAAAQTAFEKPVVTAGVFAAATFAIEASGAYATASLLDTERGRIFTDKLNGILDKLKLRNLIKTNLATEAAVAAIAGAPAAVVLKTQQDPERTKQENVRYGLIASLGITAMAGVQGWLISKGIAEPKPLTIGGALAATAAAVGGVKWAFEKFRPASAFDYEEYSSLLKDSSLGPQLRGYQKQDYKKVIQDERTSFLSLGESKRSWPVLAPIEHNTEYIASYFDRYTENGRPVLYLSLPPRDVLESQIEAKHALANALIVAGKENALVVYDEANGEDTEQYIRTILQEINPSIMLDTDNFTDTKNNTPAAAIHFEGLGVSYADAVPEGFAKHGDISRLREQYRDLVASGKIDTTSASRTILLDVADLDKPFRPDSEQTLMQRLWEIYDGQFDTLIENYPVRGKQTFEELATMLRDSGTFTAAHIIDGDVVSFTNFVSNIEACDWLDADFYKQKFPGETTVYFPGIVSDETRKGGQYSLKLIDLLTNLLAHSVDEARIVFQCTNISAAYVPRIVKWGIAASGVAKMDRVNEVCRYNYRGLTIQMPTET